MKQKNANTEKKVIKVLGIDLAKNSFQLHGVNKKGLVVLKKKLSRHQLAAFIANLPPCLIGLEACGGAHHWVRTFYPDGPYGAYDRTSVCQTVRQVQQKRCRRCRSHLRGRTTSQHAFCSGQGCRAARYPKRASDSQSTGGQANRAGELNSGTVIGIRYRHTQGDRIHQKIDPGDT